MRLILPLIFIAVPLAEIALLIKIGEIIGVLPTIALVVATAVVGVALIKRQGVATLLRAKETLDAGGIPVEAAVEGVCLLIAGAFLLTPGLITDTAGFLLLVPAFRRALARRGLGWMQRSENVHMHVYGRDGRGPQGPAPTIEGDYERVEPKPKPQDKDKGSGPRGRSGWQIEP